MPETVSEGIKNAVGIMRTHMRRGREIVTVSTCTIDPEAYFGAIYETVCFLNDNGCMGNGNFDFQYSGLVRNFSRLRGTTPIAQHQKAVKHFSRRGYEFAGFDRFSKNQKELFLMHAYAA